MSSDALEITNLLYRYGELIDAGDLAGIEGLFRHAQFKLLGEAALVDAKTTVAMLRRVVKIYPCGTPRTKHVITNPIVEIDSAARTASCRSYYTVLQSTEALPLQVIAAGRYADRFEWSETGWRFAYRDYSLFEFPGNVTAHLNL